MPSVPCPSVGTPQAALLTASNKLNSVLGLGDPPQEQEEQSGKDSPSSRPTARAHVSSRAGSLRSAPWPWGLSAADV